MSVTNFEEARHEIRFAARSPNWEKQAVSSGHGVGPASVPHSHALAIAHEATARYREFAAHMADHGHDELADLFSRLFELKAEHAYRLSEVVPRVGASNPAADDYAWLCSGSLLPETRDFIFRMLTPRHALEIAVRAEQRAQAFFERMLVTSEDAADRELAMEFGRDEKSNIAWLQDALKRVPEPFRASEECPGDPATPQAL